MYMWTFESYPKILFRIVHLTCKLTGELQAQDTITYVTLYKSQPDFQAATCLNLKILCFSGPNYRTPGLVAVGLVDLVHKQAAQPCTESVSEDRELM
jgi:hypothetical protein